MKTLFKIFILSASVLLLSSCKHEMMDYQGQAGVYFNVQVVPQSLFGDPESWAHIDTTRFSFSNMVGDTMYMSLKVRIMGSIENVDRYFDVRVVGDTATTAEPLTDYTLAATRFPIPAGERDGYVKVDFFNTDKLTDTVMFLTIELLENETFALPMRSWVKLDNDQTADKVSINVIRHVIGFTNSIQKPVAFNELIWGIYSQKKMQIILEVCGLTMDDFSSSQKMPTATAKILCQRFNKYLQAMKAKGETVYEADGVTEMTVGRLGV